MMITRLDADFRPEIHFPGISIDVVIFGYHDTRLHVLLLKHKGVKSYMLPGGFIHKDEDADNAARRVLLERTGLDQVFLEQFYTFTDPNRTDLATQQMLIDNMENPGYETSWIKGRFITIGFYALVDFTLTSPQPDQFSEVCDWHPVFNLPELLFDHKLIVEKALTTLRKQLDEKLIGINLLPETFTMKDLQVLYETVLNTKLLRANFQRKILGLNMVERLHKKMEGGAHKAPYLYRLKK